MPKGSGERCRALGGAVDIACYALGEVLEERRHPVTLTVNLEYADVHKFT
jgi:hypothetical protein